VLIDETVASRFTPFPSVVATQDGFAANVELKLTVYVPVMALVHELALTELIAPPAVPFIRH
jgi:hypothetical protein